VNIKTTLKTSVAAAALFAVAPAISASLAQAGNWEGGNDNGVVMSGQIVRSLLYIDDGENSQLFHVDGATSSTRIRWVITGQVTEALAVGGLVEADFMNSNDAGNAFFDRTNTTDETNQDVTWNLRKSVISFKHKAMGTLSIGQDSVASDGGSTQTFVGKGFTDYNGGIADVAFTNSATGALTTVSIGDVTASYDAGRDDRVRYDTPKFQGFGASVSFIDDGTWDGQINYGGKFSGIEVKAAAQYHAISANSTTVDANMGASITAQHDSGLSAGFEWAQEDTNANQTFEGERWGVNVGYKASLTDLGTTAFWIGYHENADTFTQGDETTIFSGGIHQTLPAGVDITISYHNYEYDDTTATNYDDVSMFMAGTRLQF